MTPHHPGWYPDPLHTGGQRWFNGTTWTAHQIEAPQIKNIGVAWGLALFLGAFGAHLFYLRRSGLAMLLMGLWWTATFAASPHVAAHENPLVTVVFGSAAFILYVVSLFLIGPDVRRINAGQYAAPPSD